MIHKIVTIGVYGFSESGFFCALRKAKVDTFCDIRNRRGMRGAKYAFVNSSYLQLQLSELGIRYIHRKDLAPSKIIRDKQAVADKVSNTPKRDRNSLSESFIKAYVTECLSKFDPHGLVYNLDSDSKVIALFCVEKTPEACHRSLVASELNRVLSLEVEHILPS